MKSCANCKNRASHGWDGMPDYCMGYEFCFDEETERKTAEECENFEEGECQAMLDYFEDRHSASRPGVDFGPSNPWDAPGMSVSDFI